MTRGWFRTELVMIVNVRSDPIMFFSLLFEIEAVACHFWPPCWNAEHT